MKRKHNQMKKILTYYSVMLVIVITVFAVLISFIQIGSNIETAKRTVNRSSYNLANYLGENENRLTSLLTDLTDSRKQLNNIYAYFELDYDEYLAKTLSQIESDPTKDQGLVYLPNLALNQVFYANNNVLDFGLSLANSKEKFYADEANKLGRKVSRIPNNPDSIRLYRNLLEPSTGENIGIVQLGVKPLELIDSAWESDHLEEIEGVVISPTGKILYEHFPEENSPLRQRIIHELAATSTVNLPQLKEKYYVQSTVTPQGIEVIYSIAKKSVLQDSLKVLSLILIISLIIDGILVIALVVFFNRYDLQVKSILTGVRSVGESDLGQRIPVQEEEGELKEISQGINQMLDRINQYIEDIYKLEIKQKDAHMRALQSQINPHFLYNTLEYIRMYAVSIEADELAEVVFSFASLMRNNISHEKYSTIKNELEFCEKYVYLYQMRYPNKIAYSFMIEPGLESLILPKFSLQPLVENYFVHGIDYTRRDNAIRVKAFRKGEQIQLEVTDNGRGMSPALMADYQAKLAQRNGDFGESIGLTNVNERLAAYFEKGYQMSLAPTPTGGLTITLAFVEGES